MEKGNTILYSISQIQLLQISMRLCHFLYTESLFFYDLFKYLVNFASNLLQILNIFIKL